MVRKLAAAAKIKSDNGPYIRPTRPPKRKQLEPSPGRTGPPTSSLVRRIRLQQTCGRRAKPQRRELSYILVYSGKLKKRSEAWSLVPLRAIHDL